MKMKTYRGLVSIIVLGLFAPIISNAQISFSAGIQINSASDFYQPLESYGQWITVGSYGRCWHPTVTLEAGWRPYSVGHWEWTDCGWYWVSEEPWSWACYHYGYWVYDPQFDWVWIPGTEWAPAWVVWRESPDYGYIGWAPCGPGGVAVSASLFCFVDSHHFHGAIRPNVLIINNNSLIHRTRVINGIDHETRNFDGRRERVVVNRGPEVSGIQRATGQTFAARPIRDVVKTTPLPQPILQRAESWRRENARTIQNQPQYRKNPENQPAGTGREQQRSYQQPSAPSQTATPNRPYNERSAQPRSTAPAPSTRDDRPNSSNPSGSERQRTYEAQPSALPPQRNTPSRTYTPPDPTSPNAPSENSREQRNQTQTLTPSGHEQQRTYQQPSSVPERSPQPKTYTPPGSTPSASPSPAPSQRERPEGSSANPSGREAPRVYQQPSGPSSSPKPSYEAPPLSHSAAVEHEKPHPPEYTAPAPTHVETVRPAGHESPAPPAESHAAPDRGHEKDRDK